MVSRIIESVVSGASDRRIVGHLDELQEVVCEANAASLDKAQFLIATTLNHLRTLYDNLDLKGELTLEYNVKKGHNSPERTIPRELAYLIPERYTIFSSVINAVCSCLAAGCCCLVEVEIIIEALDGTTVGVVSSRPEEEFLQKCFIIDQTGCAGLESVPTLGSRPNLCAVAIVGRTADVNKAARYIINANAFFSGRGLYAPDLILVNEFVENELMDKLRTLSLQSKPKTSGDSPKANGKLDTKPRAERLRARMFISEKMSANFNIKSPVHKEASTIPVVAVTTKYLGQFIPAQINFINYIPATLLVGPTAPEGYPVHPTLRYRRSMMEIRSPQFIQNRDNSVTSITSDWKAESLTYKEAIQPLKPDGQPIAGEINFFLQGFLASFVVYVVPLLTAVVGGGIYAVKLARDQ
ncbi:hypothetical protein GGI42DRAFT_346688 [Trichoderma sp. SZMC 28013]